MRTLLLASLVPALLVAPLSAAGQVQPIVSRFDVERFHPPPMAECSLAVGCAEAGDAGAYRVSLAAFSSLSPLVLRDGGHVGGGGFGNGTPVGDVISVRTGVQLLVAYALLDGLEVHADLPWVLGQQGDELAYKAVERPGKWGAASPVVGARWTAWSERRGAPITAALRLDAIPPIGWRPALAGNVGWVLEPRAEVAHWSETWVLATEVGANLREHDVRLGVDRLGNELTWAFSVAGRIRPMWAEAALRGSYARQASGLEMILGFHFQAGPVELYLLTSRGVGPAAGTPDIRFFGGIARSRS